MWTVESHIVDKCVVGEWGKDCFMVDLTADAEEAERKPLQLQGTFMAFLVQLVVFQSLFAGLLGTCGLYWLPTFFQAGSKRKSSWMYAYYWSNAQFQRFADVNDFSAKHISVDSVANLRWQLEERRVRCIENRSIRDTVSIEFDKTRSDPTHSPFSWGGDLMRFNSLDGLTVLGSVFGMLVTCWLLMSLPLLIDDF
jgi:hypothetical protein